jgi:hypothetical protein
MAIHPDGQEYLTGPHPNARAKALVRHRLGDDRPIEQLTAADAFGGQDGWWTFEPGGYVTADLIVAAGRPRAARHGVSSTRPGGGDTVPVVAPVAAYRAAARLRGDVRRPAEEQRFSGPGRGAPAARSSGSPGP